jgi:CheY-like chemotaxis protein
VCRRPRRGATEPPTSGARARVLLVEDNPDAADALAMLLQSLGHDVRTVHRGEDALADATRSPADVVLIDIGLPTMDGYEVATKIRRIAGMSNAVLVALTGYGATKDKEHAMSVGFDHHMTKPVDLASLQALLAEAGTLDQLQGVIRTETRRGRRTTRVVLRASGAVAAPLGFFWRRPLSAPGRRTP